MQIVIEIPEEAKIAFDNAESNDLKGCYYDHGGVIGNAIKNGTPLPKGHGRLIDADAVLEQMRNTFDMQELYLPIHLKELVIDEMPTIIEADKEVEHDD